MAKKKVIPEYSKVKKNGTEYTGRESLTQTASKLISMVKHVKRSMIKHKSPPEL